MDTGPLPIHDAVAARRLDATPDRLLAELDAGLARIAAVDVAAAMAPTGPPQRPYTVAGQARADLARGRDMTRVRRPRHRLADPATTVLDTWRPPP